MKQSRTLLVALISVGLFNACKKKILPEPENGNDPQFYFRGNVNGSDVSLEAGVNNYYMYSSYSQSTVSNVYAFGASLKEENCMTCYNSIKIEFNDWKNSSNNGPSGADSAFLSTFYPYCTGGWEPVAYSMSFYPLFNNSPQSFLWDFGDGDTSSAYSPAHTFKHAGEYNVSLTVVDQFSCSNTVSNIQKIGVSDSYCNTTITSTTTSSVNATFTHSTVGTPPYDFYWNFGDSFTSTVSIPSHTYSVQGRYPISLRVIDALSDTAYANLNYVTSSSNMCTTNYLVLGKTPISNPKGLSNIIIKWTDASGIEYVSNSSSQPPTSYFKVISVSDYHTNELGQKTKKLHIKFKCMVYSPIGSMQINNAEAVVVVAYK